MLTYSPRIITDGLGILLDASNRKSNAGEATTNVVPNPATFASWGGYGDGNDGTFTTEFGTTGYQMINRISWNGIAVSYTLPSTGTYTLSAWFRLWAFTAGNIGAAVYSSGGGIADIETVIDTSKIGVWQRVSLTVTYTTTSVMFYLISWGGDRSGAYRSTWDVTMPQVEKASAMTEWTATSRPALATDLTGNNNHTPNISSGTPGNIVTIQDGITCWDCTGTGVLRDTTNLTQFGEEHTVMVWARPRTDTGAWRTLIRGTDHPFIVQTGTGLIGYYQNMRQVSRFNSSGMTIVPSIWQLFTIVGAASRTTHWVNLISGTATPLLVYSNLDYHDYVGSYQDSQPFGHIAWCAIYPNKALNRDEITQNFNATRGRFGL
jgi:hypothetical protein